MTFRSADLQHYPLDLDALPAAWTVSDVAAISKTVQPGFPSGKHNQDGRGVPHLRPMNISRDGVIDLSEVKYVENVHGPRLAAGDVLFNNTNSPALVGKTAVIRHPDRWAFSNHMTRIAPAEGIIPSYLAYHLHYLWMSGYFRHRCVNHVNQASVSSGPLSTTVPVAIPPTAEQERIVAAIEEEFSRLDAGVAALERVRQNLSRFRAAILTAAVAGSLPTPEEDAALVTSVASGAQLSLASTLGDQNRQRMQAEADAFRAKTWPIPKGWQWLSAAELCSVITKGTSPTQIAMTTGSGDVPYIKVYNLTHDGSLDFTVSPTFIPWEIHRGLLARSSLLPGDVLTNIVGPPLGKVSLVPRDHPEWNTNQAVAAFRPLPQLNRRLLMYWLLSPPIQRLLASTSRATAGQFNLSLAACRALPLPLPPATEQAAIVLAIEEQLAVIDRAAYTVQAMFRRAHSCHSAIFAAAFSGRLVPQNPTDQPASALLDQIANDRASSNRYKLARARTSRTKVSA